MGMSLTSALRIATTGIQVSQLGLSTISHNVVNSNNANYSRQVVNTSAASYGGFGAGVQLDNLQRITDRFLQVRSLSSLADLSYAQTRTGYLSTIEGVFTTASSGGSLDSLVANVFESFNLLAANPNDNSLKRNVVQQAGMLTDTLNSTASSLRDIQNRVDGEIDAEVDLINASIRRIYELNGEIAAQTKATANGANANDLLDRRDQEINALAEKFKLNVTQFNDYGGFRISMENGRRLVDESGYVQLTRTAGSPFSNIATRNVNPDGSLSNSITDVNTDTLTQGKIKSLIDLRDNTIPDLMEEMDTFAQGLMREINAIHSRGSAFPPVVSYTTGNTANLSGPGADLYTELSAALAGKSLNISVTDTAGNPVVTTAGNSLVTPAVAATPITLPAAGPFSLNDLANLINNNPLIGNTALGGTNGVIATVGADANGKPILTIASADPARRVVMGNVTGDVLGTLGTNNLFSGTSSGDISIATRFKNNPSLLATGTMRTTDGGVSSLGNDNITALSKAGDTRFAFPAAGGLNAQTTTITGYMNQITSNVSVVVADAKSRADYAETITNQIQELKSSISGVNMNEELSLMLIYQNSFQASARIVNVVNDLFDTLLSVI